MGGKNQQDLKEWNWTAIFILLCRWKSGRTLLIPESSKLYLPDTWMWFLLMHPHATPFNIWEQGLSQKVQVVWIQGIAVHQFAGLTEPLCSQGLNYVFGFKLAEIHDLKLSVLEENVAAIHCRRKAWYITPIWSSSKALLLHSALVEKYEFPFWTELILRKVHRLILPSDFTSDLGQDA